MTVKMDIREAYGS